MAPPDLDEEACSAISRKVQGSGQRSESADENACMAENPVGCSAPALRTGALLGCAP
jgi:hypothetical protein